jgi:hypothetical protein
VRVWVPASKHLNNVADRRSVERCDDADFAWKRRQGTLAIRVEQSLGRQALFELVEGQLQRTAAFGFEMLADDLVFAFRVIHADPASCHHA